MLKVRMRSRLGNSVAWAWAYGVVVPGLQDCSDECVDWV